MRTSSDHQMSAVCDVSKAKKSLHHISDVFAQIQSFWSKSTVFVLVSTTHLKQCDKGTARPVVVKELDIVTQVKI